MKCEEAEEGKSQKASIILPTAQLEVSDLAKPACADKIVSPALSQEAARVLTSAQTACDIPSSGKECW